MKPAHQDKDHGPVRRFDPPAVRVGAIIAFPFHRFRVVAVDFVRDRAFPDAVAQVVFETPTSDVSDVGTHIATLWGIVQVVCRPSTAG
jgi:hypothetical protein